MPPITDAQKIVDYIAGMSDSFATRSFEDIAAGFSRRIVAGRTA